MNNKAVIFLGKPRRKQKRLNEMEKKAVQIEYAECRNYSAVARKYGVDDKTVKRIIEHDPDFQKKIAEKRKQQEIAILDYMDTKKSVVCDIIDQYLNEFQNPQKIEKAQLHQIATTMGILIDKFTMSDKPKEEVHPFIKELFERVNRG